MRNRLVFCVISLLLLVSPAALAWNAVGHETVAAIAWDSMTPTARRNAIALLQAAPADACLRELLPNDNRPLEERQREFFIRASTWADLVRPGDDDMRPCTRFHQRDWHFINVFWEGISGAGGANAPQDRDDIDTPAVNAVERLRLFRPFVACGTPACGTPISERATTLAWIVHLVGDIHQPLHTAARVTNKSGEQQGDQGGNLFKLGPDRDSPSLHSFWDGIINRSIQRRDDEKGANEIAYINRVETAITQEHPRSAVLAPQFHAGDFEEWSEEGLATAKQIAYPQSLRRARLPDDAYRERVFDAAKSAIALAGYRLADLLNQMLGQ